MKTKSAAAKKRAVHYDPNNPCCENCIEFRRAIQGRPPLCARHTFFVKSRGLCDTWKGTDGSVLDDAKK